MSFGALVSERRRDRKLSQRRLAAAVDVNHTYISKLENDRLPPPATKTVLRLAAALECDALLLLRARRPVPPPLEGLTAEQWQALAEWLGFSV
jgi:transcriptional regulator with XRE-family HTH domain